MKKFVLITFISLFIFSACKYGADNFFYPQNSVHNREKNITYLSNTGVEGLSSSYSFAVMTDVHYWALEFQKAPAMPDSEFLSWLDALPSSEKPGFCLVLGDVVDYGAAEQYPAYVSFIDNIESRNVKVFNVAGNHDLYNSGWDNWRINCYPHTSFYNFKTSGFSFYGLDTGSGGPGYEQLTSLQSAFSVDSKPKIVFSHYPFFSDSLVFSMCDSTERNLALDMFQKNNVRLYLCGHIHKYELYDFGTLRHLALPSFRYDGIWALVTVDESSGTYSVKFYNKNGLVDPNGK